MYLDFATNCTIRQYADIVFWLIRLMKSGLVSVNNAGNGCDHVVFKPWILRFYGGFLLLVFRNDLPPGTGIGFDNEIQTGVG